MFGRNTHWRQGQILCNEGAERIEADIDHHEACFVIVSHDCDLSSADDTEPVVEVIRAVRIDRLDGNFTYAKNPRKLHVQCATSGECFALAPQNKLPVPRENLAGFRQCPNRLGIRSEDLTTLKEWLASRYARSAFPDNFNTIFRPYEKKLRKLIAQYPNDLLAVYVDLNGDEREESPEGDSYELGLHFVFTDEAALDDAMMQAFRNRAQEIFATTLNASHSPPFEIILDDVFLVSEMDFSLGQARRLQRWNQEDLSFREEGSPFVGHAD